MGLKLTYNPQREEICRFSALHLYLCYSSTKQSRKKKMDRIKEILILGLRFFAFFFHFPEISNFFLLPFGYNRKQEDDNNLSHQNEMLAVNSGSRVACKQQPVSLAGSSYWWHKLSRRVTAV